MLDLIYTSLDSVLPKITAVIILVVSGFCLRVTLQLFGQSWIKTKAHTTTLLILPVITYSITNVISGNIALSLGMVGALSIVRFRNPVRSPLELSTYFAAITMGISASVSLQWLLFLILSIVMVITGLALIDYFSTKFLKRPLFIASFSEGNSLSTLTIKSSQEVELCEKHKLLQSKQKNQSEIIYSFASDNFDTLRTLEHEPEIQLNNVSIELRR